jgi:hypothetical protein
MRRELVEAIPPIRILYRFRGRNEINGYSKQAGAARAVNQLGALNDMLSP